MEKRWWPKTVQKFIAIERLWLQQQGHIWVAEFYDTLPHALTAKFFPCFLL